MALGTYNKTTYQNGQAPAINQTNLNNNENKTKELDDFAAAVDIKLDDYNISASSPDINGIFTVVDYRRRADGTLYLRTTLSNPNADLKYGTVTLNYYNAAGDTVINTQVWTITYDSSGAIIGLEVA
jgi:hypothetical protein